jgi:DNA repair exonuclease SbcCD ATPase subunit
MDTADWILIIILVVICAIALVWFGAWLCKGSAPVGPRVTGQGEAAKNAVRTAMSVFDYLRPRSKVAVGAAEYVGGVDDTNVGVELPLEQLKALILKLNPQPTDPGVPESLSNIVTDLRNRYFRYKDVSNNPSNVFVTSNRNVTDKALSNLVVNLNARQNSGEEIPSSEWENINEMLKAPKASRQNGGAPTREDFANEVTTYVSKHPAPTIREAMNLNIPTNEKGLEEATKHASQLAADLTAATQKIAELAKENAKLGEEKDAATKANEAAQLSIATLNDTISKLEEAKRESGESIQAAQLEKDGLTAKMTELEASKNALTQQLAAAQQSENGAKSQVLDLGSRIADLERQIAQAALDKTAAETKASADMAALEAQKAAAAAEAQTKFDEDIKNLKTQAVASAASAEQRISSLNAQIEELRKQLSAAGVENTKLQSESAELRTKISELEATATKVSSDVQQKDAEILRLTEEVAKASTGIGEAKGQLNDALKELAVLNDKVADLESKLGMSKQALDEKHALVSQLLELGKQLVQDIGTLREQEAADIRAIESRLETLATKPNMNLAQLIETHSTLASAADESAFQLALKVAMERDPVHAVASMIVTDRASLEEIHKSLENSFVAVNALRRAAEDAPKKPRNGFFGPLVDWMAAMGSDVSSLVDGLANAIKKDQADILTLREKAIKFEADITSMGLDILDLKTRMANVETITNAAPTAANIDAMKQEIENLRRDMENNEGDNYGDEYYIKPQHSISPQTLAGL